jgi:predicted secreted protein
VKKYYAVEQCADSLLFDMNTPGYGAVAVATNSSSVSLTNCHSERGYAGGGAGSTGKFADDDSALRLENTTFHLAVRTSFAAGLAMFCRLCEQAFASCQSGPVFIMQCA